MERALVLQKVMYGCHITHCQSLVRHQQQPRKVSGKESLNQQEPDRGRNISPVTKQWSELASDASLATIKFRSPIMRMGLSGKEKEAGEGKEGYLRLGVSYSCVYVHQHLSIHHLAAISWNF